EDASKKADARLKALVEELASDDPDTRRRAAALLEREGEDAVPVLSGALFHASTFARERAASILGKLNARAAVRTMLVALRSAVPEIKKVRPWQRAFVKAVNTSLAKITGRNFRVSLRTGAQGKVVDKYLEWWDGPPAAKPDRVASGSSSKATRRGEVPKGACVTWDTPQVGEKEIAEDDPEREKKLWESRRVGKERRTYTPPKSFTDPFGQR
ncbi:MAG: HEAT repeat domain-containing protein, partial [Planctomycetota bacterium]